MVRGLLWVLAAWVIGSLAIGCGGGPPPLPSVDAGPCADLYGAVCAASGDAPACDAYLSAALVEGEGAPLTGAERRGACALALADPPTRRLLRNGVPSPVPSQLAAGRWAIDVVATLGRSPDFAQLPPAQLVQRLQSGMRMFAEVSMTLEPDGRMISAAGERQSAASYVIETGADGAHTLIITENGRQQTSRVRFTAAGLELEQGPVTLQLVPKPEGGSPPHACGRLRAEVCGASIDPQACWAAVVPQASSPITQAARCRALSDEAEAVGALRAKGAEAARAASPFIGTWIFDADAALRADPKTSVLSPAEFEQAREMVAREVGRFEATFAADGQAAMALKDEEGQATWRVIARVADVVVVEFIERAGHAEELVLRLEGERLTVFQGDESIYFKRR